MPFPPDTCVICGATAEVRTEVNPSTLSSDCPSCGQYQLREVALRRLYQLTHAGGDRLPDHHLYASTIRDRFEQTRERVVIQEWEELEASLTRVWNALDAADRLLMFVSRRMSGFGSYVKVKPADYPVVGGRNQRDLDFVLDLCTRKVGYLRLGEHGRTFYIEPEGWRRLEELRAQTYTADLAFVAMWFNEETRPAFSEGIEPALRAVGYDALRVDIIQHNDKIDDRIIAEIRRSELVVADFTGQRQNVYFEAGFAQGLGRHVIRTVRAPEEASLAFDTRQYNHIVWSTPEELREQLEMRIRATVPGRAARKAV